MTKASLIISYDDNISRGKEQFMRAFLHSLGYDHVFVFRRRYPNKTEKVLEKYNDLVPEDVEVKYDDVLVVPPANGRYVSGFLKVLRNLLEITFDNVWVPEFNGRTIDGFYTMFGEYEEVNSDDVKAHEEYDEEVK